MHAEQGRLEITTKITVSPSVKKQHSGPADIGSPTTGRGFSGNDE